MFLFEKCKRVLGMGEEAGAKDASFLQKGRSFKHFAGQYDGIVRGRSIMAMCVCSWRVLFSFS